MLKRIWLFIQGIEYSVEHIVSKVGTMVRELEQHAADQFTKAYDHQQDAAKSTAKSIAAQAKALEAETIAKNFKALIVTK